MVTFDLYFIFMASLIRLGCPNWSPNTNFSTTSLLQRYAWKLIIPNCVQFHLGHRISHRNSNTKIVDYICQICILANSDSTHIFPLLIHIIEELSDQERCHNQFLDCFIKGVKIENTCRNIFPLEILCIVWLEITPYLV